MEQHAVPQNVTTFQFRLIGDMTLKQFGYLCAGAILAFIAYKLPLPVVFTWPLTFVFAFFGVGFAFIPVEERPMDVWVFSFFKSIYNPTQYIWSHKTQPQAAPVVPPSAPKTAPSSVKTVLSGLFKRTPAPVSHPPVGPQQPPQPKANPLQQKISQLEETLKTLEGRLAQKTVTEERVLELQKQLTDVLSQKSITEEELIALKRKIAPQAPQEPPSTSPPGTVNVITTQEGAVKAGLPRLTNAPNVITGIVKDDAGNMLPGILITVTNAEGIPVRALKTNKLGQFAASTPLPSGTYFVEIEDPRGRFTFSRIQITLTGAVVPILEIIAKSEKALTRERLAQEIFGKPMR